jgi:hypothetical protein
VIRTDTVFAALQALTSAAFVALLVSDPTDVLPHAEVVVDVRSVLLQAIGADVAVELWPILPHAASAP